MYEQTSSRSRQASGEGMKYYILNGQTPIPTDDILKWGRMMQGKERQVSQTTLKSGVLISTVFLGLDHNLSGNGIPHIFETMIFGGPLDGYQARCSTWDEAVEMHFKAVKLAEETK